MKHILAGLLSCLFLAASGLCIIVMTGCEDDDEVTPPTSTTGVLSVSPSYASFSASSPTTLVFTASGGSSGGYTWSIDDISLGSITSTLSQAIYTSTTNTGRNFLTLSDSSNQVLTATIDQL